MRRTIRPKPIQFSLMALGIMGATLLGGCSGDPDEPGPDDAGPSFSPAEIQSESERLEAMINDSYRIQTEIRNIEQRVTKRCMEELGFTEHSPESFLLHEWNYEVSLLDGAPLGFIPTVDEAGEIGFGWWEHAPGAMDRNDLPEIESEGAVNVGGTSIEEFEAWEALGEEYIAEWTEALTGYGPDAETYTESTESEGWHEEAKPGGCELEAIETIYGEPYRYEYEHEETIEWRSYPPNPGTEKDIDQIAEGWEESLGEEPTAFLDCIADRGYEGWEFEERFSLPIFAWFNYLYAEGDPQFYDAEALEQAPELPEDAPTEFDEIMAWEIEVAVDLAECGDESGLRDAIAHAYQSETIDYYLGLEVEMLAWNEEMNGYLENAQDYFAE